MSSVLDIAKKINKSWKDDVLTSGNFTKEEPKLSMGDLGFDYPSFGGLPYGTISVFSGLEHSGKTVASCTAMAQYQKENPDKVCIYVDAENTLLQQQNFIHKMTGLDFSEEHFLRYDMIGKSAEEMFTDIIDLQQADNIGMIIIDSAPALVSQTDMDNDFAKDNGMRASIAKSLGKFCRMMQMYLPVRNNILLFINQVRISGKTFTGANIYTEPCGHALNYYPTFKVRFGTRKYTKGDVVDLSPSKGEGADGFRLQFSITKSRIGSTTRGGGFLTYRLETGLDKIHDMLEIAIKYEFIQRPTTQSYLLVNLDTGEVYKDENGNELKIVGKKNVIEYINTHKEFQEKYFEMLTKHISESSKKVNLLNEEDLEEILTQEKSVSNEKINE